MSEVVDALMESGNSSMLYEVIRQMSSSITALGARMEAFQAASISRTEAAQVASGLRHDEVMKAQLDILTRVVSLEASRQFQERIENQVMENKGKIDMLYADMLRRNGAIGAFGFIWKYAPHAWAAIVSLVLAGRALGVVHFPSDEPKTVIPSANVTVTGPTAGR